MIQGKKIENFYSLLYSVAFDFPSVHGCGEGAFWHGKRRLSRSARPCCLILFCRILFLTGSGGFFILLKVTLSKGLVSISHCLSHLWSAAIFMWSSWSKFRWRFQCLFGDSFETDFQQKIIWFVGESFIMTTSLVLKGTVARRLRFIFFSDVTSLVASGTLFISGLVFLSYLQRLSRDG